MGEGWYSFVFNWYSLKISPFLVGLNPPSHSSHQPAGCQNHLLGYRYMNNVRGNLFSLLCLTWRALFKMLWDYFGLSKWKPRKKFSRSYLQRRKIEKRRQKELLTTWEGLKYKKSSETAAIVCHRYERLAVLQNAFAIILLWAIKDVGKRFEEAVCK